MASRDEFVDRGLQCGATDQQRIDRAEVVQQRDLRAALTEVDTGSPLAVMLGPCAAGPVEAHVVAQQQLGQPVTGAHQITANVLAGAHEIAQRLLAECRDAHRVQPADHQQPQHPLGVATVGLDAIARRPFDLARRRHDTTHARRLERPREPEPGRPGLIGHPHRTRQPVQNSTTSAVVPGNRRIASSPDSLSMLAATTRPA